MPDGTCLADVARPHEADVAVVRERAARVLVSILPRAAAPFITEDPACLLSSQPDADVAERLVALLASHGASALEKAASAYSRILVWAAEHRPGVRELSGSHVADFLASVSSTRSALEGFDWLRDHCGLVIPSRGAAARASRGLPPVRPRDDHSISLLMLLGLELLAATHPSQFVRGQAAGWFVLAKAGLRVEQARDVVVNAIAPVDGADGPLSLLSAACRRDKHPDRRKRRPRPVWAIVSGLAYGDAVERAFRGMLDAAPGACSLIVETDALSGDPADATRWVRSSIEGAKRTSASIQALLVRAGFAQEVAARFHGHSCKRFLQCVCRASPRLGREDAQEFGAFSQSATKMPHLQPRAELLRQHDLRAAVLPDMYARDAVVEQIVARFVRLEAVLVSAVSAAGAHSLPAEGGFLQVFGGR